MLLNNLRILLLLVCGSEHCLVLVKGAQYLLENALKNYQLTDFIQDKLSIKSR